MLAMARSRRYCFQSIGALGVIEMTAPTRAGFVDAGLKRLRIPTKKRLYFTLHAVTGHQTFRMLEPRGAAVAGQRKPRAPSDRRRRFHSALARRAVLRTLSAPLRLEQPSKPSGLGLEGSAACAF